MAVNQTYAVFGLGRYGTAVAKELTASGAEVLTVDRDEDIVNDRSSFLPYCKCADVTDPEALQQLGIANIDVVILAMAGNLESSVMAAMLCKEFGVKTVIAKCSSDMNCRIMSRVGADQVIVPEHESGVRLAKSLLSAGFTDIVELSQDVSMLELEVRPEWVGKSLSELNLRRKFSINVVAMVKGSEISVNIDPEKALEEDVRLIVIANVDKLRHLRRQN